MILLCFTPFVLFFCIQYTHSILLWCNVRFNFDFVISFIFFFVFAFWSIVDSRYITFNCYILLLLFLKYDYHWVFTKWETYLWLWRWYIIVVTVFWLQWLFDNKISIYLCRRLIRMWIWMSGWNRIFRFKIYLQILN